MAASRSIYSDEKIIEAITKPKPRVLQQWARETGEGALWHELEEGGERVSAFSLALAQSQGFEKPAAAIALWKGAEAELEGEDALRAVDELLGRIERQQEAAWTPLLDAALGRIARTVAMEKQLQWWQDPLKDEEERLRRIFSLIDHGGHSRQALKTLQALLSAGLNPNFHAANGEYSLLFAGARSSPQITTMLLKAGANPLWKNHRWQTPAAECFYSAKQLSRCFSMGSQLEVLDVLLQALERGEENFELLTTPLSPELRKQAQEKRKQEVEEITENVPTQAKASLEHLLMNRQVAAGKSAPRLRM